jgi:ribosomal protein S18 acetylase RimI-like enzyme
VRFQPALPGDRAAALALVFAHLPPADRVRRLSSELPQGLETPRGQLWAAYRGERLAAALLAQSLPGKTAIISPPRISSGQPRELIRELLERAVADLPRQGIQLAQTLMETDHGADVDLLREVGFRHACDLLFLASLRNAFPQSPTRGALEFVEYTPRNHARLAAVIERTYAGSLDCPQLESARDVEDVLAGYRAAGAFDPAHWMIVEHEGADVGCLLLALDPPNDQCELTYMGLVSEARGRGFGITMVRHAQRLVAKAGRERLMLAVDANNTPAIAVYAAAGFVSWDKRSVFLRLF